ncbi:potassium channel family protein [Solirubrobacter soli]|uniref:potassium channel family protein n=1 Tax=Solirubrobacter soli TaxID=363832 RepID=UPI0004076FF2|nr:potassium channel family protein [Solirubrobacter soli]
MEDWPRNEVLLLCVVAAVAVQGAIPSGDVQRVLVSVLLGTILIGSFRMARATGAVRFTADVFAVAGVAAAILRSAGVVIGEGQAQLMNAAVAAIAPPAVALGVLRELRSTDRIGLGPVTGVITLYMLLGMMWAFIYGTIDEFGGSFFAENVPATASLSLYYSFVTLATVGYGDYTARSDLGHTLSIFESLLGQIYLVTVVSLIVGNLGRTRPRRVEPGKEPQ